MAETKRGNANVITRDYLDAILVEERLIDAVTADISMELWGRKYASPIMMPAFSHLPVYAEGRDNGLVEYARATKTLNIVNWIGMIDNGPYEAVAAVKANTVRIIKPYADRVKIESQIAYAEETGAVAVGIDTDHIFGYDGDYDVVLGERMAPRTQEDIARFVQSTKLPFIIKGVLSVTDAKKCLEAGVQGIVVSHHSGRMPFAIPPLAVLPQIRAAVGKDMKIFVDCNINSGVDAFKALALGADAVSVGRVIIPDLKESGEEGVVRYITKMNQELRMMMNYTGTATLAQMDPTTLHLPERI